MANVQLFLQSTAPGFGFTVVNPDNQKALIYIGVAASLQATLVNNTGADIPLRAGAAAATLKVYLPNFVSAAAYGAVQISPPAGWQFSVHTDANVDDDAPFLLLTYGAADGLWPMGSALAFTITNVLSNGQPGTDSLQIAPDNLPGAGVPLQVVAPVSLSNAPVVGNAKLLDTLEISLENQGTVYVSTPNDPLVNSLFLNFKNIGSKPLYTGATPPPSPPQVLVTFVYGNTSGALTEDDQTHRQPLTDDPLVNSAWLIKAHVQIAQSDTTSWTVSSPSPTGGTNEHPQWTMQPANTNLALLGTGAHANLTLAFSPVVTFAPTGHTQMIVQLLNFWQDETKRYDDEVVVLDIVKQAPPATRGLINFFSPDALHIVYSPQDAISIKLRWAMFLTAKINLLTNLPGVGLHTKTYDGNLPLQYDTYEISTSGIEANTAAFITIQAFGRDGAYLNSLQFTVFIEGRMLIDAHNQVYPAVLLNNQLWMAQNLSFNPGPGDTSTYGDTSYVARFGRLYSAAAAQGNVPPGWRLPTLQDWQGLINAFPANGLPSPAAAAYQALIGGGDAHFNALLGGYYGSSLIDQGASGYYWCSTPQNSGGMTYVQFAGQGKTVVAGNGFSPDKKLSVRYVKDI